jgi:hypothetical protein
VTKSWTAGWEIEFPARTREELLAALVVRDLVHGATFDVETEDGSAEFEVDYEAGEELLDDVYRLLIAAEIRGPEDHAMLGAFTEQMLEESIEEAEGLVGKGVDLEAAPFGEVSFEIVGEDDERWDLVVPEWLAPEGAEIPFGFRPVRGGAWWPDDTRLDAHGRIAVVPYDGSLHLIGLPAPSNEIETTQAGA